MTHHSVQIRDYRGCTDNTIRKLPDGRSLVTGANQPAKVIDLDNNEMTVSSVELVALIAVSTMSFPKSFQSADPLDRD